MTTPKLVIASLSSYKEMLGINPQDGKAMDELRLELHKQAHGQRAAITADEILDLHLLLAELTDLRSLVKRPA
jgi:hypothetical protein